MQAYDRIKSSLEYIGKNLKTEITAEELADIAGYSVWHYCRLFSKATGMTVACNICKLRIDNDFGEIAEGRRAIDTVLDYGFDTYRSEYLCTYETAARGAPRQGRAVRRQAG